MIDLWVWYWKWCIDCQKQCLIQMKPLEENQMETIITNHNNLERRVDKIEYEVYGIYV